MLSGACSGDNTITRTWTATDCSGNAATGIQTIIVTDNTKPVATVPNLSVGCPADIPTPHATLAQFITAGGTATDNCGALSLILFNEIANGLAGKPGLLSDKRYTYLQNFRSCGNYNDVVQTISKYWGNVVVPNVLPARISIWLFIGTTNRFNGI